MGLRQTRNCRLAKGNQMIKPGAARHDTDKIELHHIVPEVWNILLTESPPEGVTYHSYMDNWFYNRSVDIPDLINDQMFDQMCRVLSFGSKKYAALNYAKGMKYSRVLNSYRRHELALMRGEVLDHESGLPHAAHMLCNTLFAFTYHVLGYDGGEFDDRPLKEIK